ncbi:MAG: glycoside hydrolase 5 family protein [Acidimicrobiia bacterium]
MVSADPEVFRLGVNYWPAEHAMGWLAAYDAAITRRDFARARAAGLDSLRIFVRWADVQPAEATIDSATLEHLADAADAASEAGATLIVTLFVGHMSGVNWAPEWATGGADGDRRFRVLSPGAGSNARAWLRNWYSDPAIGAAQERLATAVASALAGHPAVWMWDLGNENSNCTIPPDAATGSAWLEQMTAAIRTADPGRRITVGLHMEDLEDDRRIGPAEVARHCEVVSMHGYPPYTSWADGPVDDRLLPFLTLVTRWIAGGAEVLFEEFGLPTASSPDTGPDWLIDEGTAAAYTGRALDGLRAAGCSGALLWCFADYTSDLHRQPPFDEAVHERSFGLWRSDGSPKPAVAEITRRAGLRRRTPPADLPWLDIGVDEFLADRRGQMSRLYQRYCHNRPRGNHAG